jgi:hypothetical protein
MKTSINRATTGDPDFKKNKNMMIQIGKVAFDKKVAIGNMKEITDQR